MAHSAPGSSSMAGRCVKVGQSYDDAGNGADDSDLLLDQKGARLT